MIQTDYFDEQEHPHIFVLVIEDVDETDKGAEGDDVDKKRTLEIEKSHFYWVSFDHIRTCEMVLHEKFKEAVN